ncbi:MAG TPA: CDP-diacylglycerol--serine O-phosphatidyltransferase [Gemmatimonadales bacterium]|nr:CDP-diacylglycerol--serine O-phosphatidyltransferase [Gemmatimonadales bacterium]
MSSPPPQREGIRKVVVVIPSAFTIGNLFFGFWSIISAFNGNFRQAGWFIVYAGILDSLDGRVARRMGTGSRFGAELDSLVDIVSFGVAPALLIYFLEFSAAGRFGWVVCFLYVVAAALRLARFNVLSHGKPTPGWFTGLPSPAAGMTMATYYAFSQTQWYRASVAYMDLQHEGLVVLLLLTAALMVSKVQYPRGGPINLKRPSGLLVLAVVLGFVVGSIVAPSSFLFPFFLTYLTFGVLRHVVLRLIDTGGDE